MESNEIQYKVEQICVTKQQKMIILEDQSKLYIKQSNGFTILSGEKHLFQMVIMNKIQTLVINQDDFRVYVIQKEKDVYYQLVFRQDQGQEEGWGKIEGEEGKGNWDVLDEILHINGDITFQQRNGEQSKTPQGNGEIIEKQQDFVVIHPQRQQPISDILKQNGEIVKDNLVETGIILGGVIRENGLRVLQIVKPSRVKELDINPKLLALLTTLGHLSKHTFLLIKEQLEKWSNKAFYSLNKHKKENPSGKVNQVMSNQHFNSVLQGVSTVFEGLAMAGDLVFENLRLVAKVSVKQTFGVQASEAIDSTFGIINNIKSLTKVHRIVLKQQALQQIKNLNQNN